MVHKTCFLCISLAFSDFKYWGDKGGKKIGIRNTGYEIFQSNLYHLFHQQIKYLPLRVIKNICP